VPRLEPGRIGHETLAPVADLILQTDGNGARRT
jgi:hypothetical protein